MKLERAKSQILPGVVTPSKKQASARTIPLQAKAATPIQLQRAKNKLEQDRRQIQRQAEQASIQRTTRVESQEQVQVQRLQDQAVAQEQQARVQRLAETQARQQSFFSGFVKSPVQRQFQAQVKNSSVQTAQARDQYQTAVQPEILQRLVDNQMGLQLQQTRASQPQNDLNARAEWFNTELPVLRAQHNHPDTPFLDGANVFKPADQQAFTLGKTYGIQRLSSGLTPKDAASAILNIQRKADRDIALRGLLTGINPRQSDYTSIQRLVAQGETKLELQRTALLEDPAMQSQALQLAKDEAHPTSPNSGIADKIKTKLGGGNPLPENVRQQLEAGLNTDLSGVRVHTDSEADFLSKSVQAKAFTTGNDIFFSSGAFDPNTKSGFELIAHETTHTLQQASGQVQPGIDSDPSLETAAQAKGAELASGFNPNFKYKNLENQAQPNSPLIASQPPAHRVKLQAMQRSSLKVQREPQAPTPVSPILDETALATLTTALLPVVPQKYQSDAQSNIPVILRQCFSSQIKNANQVAYILATAQHESRFGTKMYSRSESLVEDHNPLKTEHKKVKDPTTKKTHVEDIPYRSNHVTGNRVNADPSNTDNLDTYYDDAYGAKLGNVKGSSDAANYRGRGFVQITGRDNYKRLGTQLQNEGFTYTYDKQTYGGKEQPIDLVANPTHVNLVPELAAKIMVSGMQNDSFSQGGKGLSTYVNDKTSDFVGARGLVNGTDRAVDIAKIAEDFAKILNANNAWSNLFAAPDLTKSIPDQSQPAVTPNQTMQRSSLGLQREAKPQAGQNDGSDISIAIAKQYRIMLNSSPNSTTFRNYIYGEAKTKWDAANQKAKQQMATWISQPNPADRSEALFATAMSIFLDDPKAQSIFVLGRVLDPQTTTRIKNQYNALQGAEKQTVLGLMNTELNSIPVIQINQKAIAENEIFGQLSHKFAEFCLYKVMLTKYPQTNTPAKPSNLASSGALSGLGAVIDSGGITLRKAPGTNSEAIQHYPQRSVFFISKAPEDPTWFKARALDGKEGYIAGYLVKVAPEIGAKLYEIKSGDNASSIVIRNYPNMDGILKRSERHKMIAALSYLNPTLMPKPSSNNGWDDVKTLPGFIWLPSLEFAKKIASQVVVNDDFAGKFADGTANVADKSLTALAETGEYVVKNVLKQLPGGEQVLETIQKIGANAGKVLDDPGAFVKHLGQAVSQGFGQFTANLPQHLEASVVKLFTGTMGGIELPKTWDATGVLHVGLQMIGGTPEQLKQKLITAVPGGQAAIDASGEAKAAFSSIQQNGFAATARQYYEGDALQETIIGGIKSYVINTVVKQGMIALGSMFIPGAGLVQAAIKLYETIKFVWEKMKDIAATISAITSSLAEIAAGNIGAAATKVKDSLVGVLGLGVGFLARVAHLDGIADKVKALFNKIKKPIENAIAKVIAWFKGLVGGKGSSKPLTGDKSNSSATNDTKTSKTLAQILKGRLFEPLFFIGKNKQTYKVWVEVNAGTPKFILNPTPTEATQKLSDYESKMKAQKLEATMSPYISLGRNTVASGMSALQNELTKKGDDPNKAEALEMGKSYAKKLKGVYETLANALDAQDTYPFVTEANGVKRIQPVSITFDVDSKNFNVPEYQRQILRQEIGLNKLELPQWFTNRSKYIDGGRDDAGSDSQDKFRDFAKAKLRLDIADKIMKKIDPTTGKNFLPGVAESKADQIIAWIMKNKAVLHEPDQVAGGNPVIKFDPANIDWSLLGSLKVNSSIGSQWSTRVHALDKEVAKVPETLRVGIFMNTHLQTKVK